MAAALWGWTVKTWNLGARPPRLPLWKLAIGVPLAFVVQGFQWALRRAEMKRPSSAAIDAANDVLNRGGRQ